MVHSMRSPAAPASRPRGSSVRTRHPLRAPLLALLIVTYTSAHADAPCSGGDEGIARPIAEALLAYASVAPSPFGKFAASLHSSVGLSNQIDIRYSIGDSVVYKGTATVEEYPDDVASQSLPPQEGFGFAVKVTAGGSGYGTICTYGFRLKDGAVSYRTLAAVGQSRTGPATDAGVVTDWKTLTGAVPPPPASPVALTLRAAALGEVATNGGALRLNVPVHVGIEIALSATIPSTTAWVFDWAVDGQSIGSGTRFVRWLPAGEHSVQVQAWEAGNYPGSTPGTIAASTASSSARVTVAVVENPHWSCLGRLGSGCSDSPMYNAVFTTPLSVAIACLGKPDQFCISSWMSVGAIRHDRCCEQRNAKGLPHGYRCDNLSPKEDPSACTAEWKQAQIDSKIGQLAVAVGFAAARFEHLWVYPPNGSDGPSSARTEWWRGVVDPGVILSYSEVQPDREDMLMCKFGRASKRGVDMANSKLAAGPILAAILHAWVCTCRDGFSIPHESTTCE